MHLDELLNLLVFFLIPACILAFNPAWAQEMPTIDLEEKKYSNMDSRLASMYEEMLAGDEPGMSDSAVLFSSDGDRVQVVLEMVSADAPIPENLGIEVETTYENLVQATVPVRNLEAIASDENVLRISLPSTPVPAMVLPPSDPALVQPLADGNPVGEFDPAYAIIPAIALPAIAIAFAWKRTSKK